MEKAPFGEIRVYLQLQTLIIALKDWERLIYLITLRSSGREINVIEMSNATVI